MEMAEDGQGAETAILIGLRNGARCTTTIEGEDDAVVIIEFTLPILKAIREVTCHKLGKLQPPYTALLAEHDVLVMCDKQYESWKRTIHTLLERLGKRGFGELPITLSGHDEGPPDDWDDKYTWVKPAEIYVYKPKRLW